MHFLVDFRTAALFDLLKNPDDVFWEVVVQKDDFWSRPSLPPPQPALHVQVVFGSNLDKETWSSSFPLLFFFTSFCFPFSPCCCFATHPENMSTPAPKTCRHRPEHIDTSLKRRSLKKTKSRLFESFSHRNVLKNPNYVDNFSSLTGLTTFRQFVSTTFGVGLCFEKSAPFFFFNIDIFFKSLLRSRSFVLQLLKKWNKSLQSSCCAAAAMNDLRTPALFFDRVFDPNFFLFWEKSIVRKRDALFDRLKNPCTLWST